MIQKVPTNIFFRPNSEFHWNPEQGYEELRASRLGVIK